MNRLESLTAEIKGAIEKKTGESFDTLEYRPPRDNDMYEACPKILTPKDVDKMVSKAINLKIK
jgi:hypothetical protein